MKARTNSVSDGKLIKSKVKQKKNRAGQAFRSAANTLWKSNSHFGVILRKKASKGSKSAVVFRQAGKYDSKLRRFEPLEL